MILIAIGIATFVLGMVSDVQGLVVAGGWWILTGLVISWQARAVAKKRAENKALLEAGGSVTPESVVDGRRLVLANVLMLLVAVPSLLIGILPIGIDADDIGWRWLPIGVGGVAAALAVVSVSMFVTGARVTPSGEVVGAADKQATIVIKSMRETGTYVNERPRLEFEMRVQPDGMVPYEVTKRATVPYTAMGSLRIGDGFRALVVGPDKPTAMEIDWSAPVSGSDRSQDGAGEDAESRLATLDELRHTGRITEDEYDRQRRRILDSI